MVVADERPLGQPTVRQAVREGDQHLPLAGAQPGHLRHVGACAAACTCFDSAEDAVTSRGTVLFQTMAANPAFAELSVREFAVLDAPTAITGPAVVR